jgi:hypothetical protein
MPRDRVRLVSACILRALVLLTLLAFALPGPVAAQARKAEEEFSLDENATPAAAAPAPAPAAAAQGEQPALLSDEQALQEEQASDEKFRESTDPYEDPKKSYWFVGAAWRYTILPSGVLEWFMDAAPGVSTAASIFGEFGWRKSGFQVTAQAGWMKLDFAGPFQLAGDPPEDTEWLKGDLNFVQATAAVTWSTSCTDWFALEYGLEAGFGIVIGDIIRSEAYPTGNGWGACPTYAANPAWPSDVARTAEATIYCDTPINYNPGAPIPPTNEAGEIGAHYNVKANQGIGNKGVPHAIPVLGPRLSLRFKPIAQLVLRVDLPLPLLPYGFVGGLSAQYGF